jgi:site-specific DNA recombinase
MSKPLAAYVRVSRVGDRTDTLISPELQAERIKAWASARGDSLVFLPAELDESGGNDDRPILMQAIEGVESGDYSGIAVAQLDRFGRSTASALAMLKRVETAGGKVHSVSEPLDSASPEGNWMRTALLATATMERERHQRGFDVAKADAIARGLHIGPVPFGYVKGEDRRLAPHPERAPLVREAFERRSRGESWKRLADWLEKSEGGVKTIIHGRVYLGEVAAGEHRNPNAHEPIVSRDLWEAAQLEHPRPPRGTFDPALLAGIVRCAGCGYMMSPGSGRGKGGVSHRNYICKRRHASGRCPEPAMILGYLLEPIVVEAVLSHVREAQPEASERTTRVQSAEARLAVAEAELAAYRDSPLIASTLGPVDFAAGLAPRRAAVDAASEELGHARASVRAPDSASIADHWDEMPIESRRAILRDVLGVVWVRRGRADAHSRIRIVQRGFEPSDLPRRNGGNRSTMRTLVWESDLPGEIRVQPV